LSEAVKGIDVAILELGVLKKDIKPLTITPALQYSNTPKLSEIKSPPRMITLFL
jgi:hypothetical protein